MGEGCFNSSTMEFQTCSTLTSFNNSKTKEDLKKADSCFLEIESKALDWLMDLCQWTIFTRTRQLRTKNIEQTHLYKFLTNWILQGTLFTIKKATLCKEVDEQASSTEVEIRFSIRLTNSLKAFSVNDSRSSFIILCLADPHCLKCWEGS